MGFRKQLIAGQAALIIVTLVTGLTAVITLHVTTRSADRVAREFTNDLTLVERTQLEAEQLVAASRGYLLTGEPRYRIKMIGIEQQLESSLAELRARTHLSTELANIERHVLTYVDAVRRAGKRRVMAGDPGAIEELFERDLTPRRDVLKAEVDAFVEREQREFDAVLRDARDLTRHAQITLVLTSALGIGIAVALAIIVMRRLAQQFERVQSANEIARREAAARKELLDIVSHDLRSPLGSVVLSASMLKEAAHGGPEERLVNTIVSATDRMRHLVDDLLDVSRLQTGAVALDRRSWSVRSLLAVTADLFRHAARERGVALRVECSVAGQIEVDRERILQVLSNLVGNAIQAVDPDAEVVIGADARDGWVRFAVTDTGPGMLTSDASQIFERYRQGTGTRRGSLGLGLYICKSLVEAHQGHIGVESAVGKGSTFWFDLPAGPSAVAQGVGAPSARSEPEER